MRPEPNIRIEVFRKIHPRLGPTPAGSNTGYFEVLFHGRTLTVVASDGLGWEHVSVSLTSRCPNWDEMCYIKDLFWTDDETVVQYHPRTVDYVDKCRTCLHLWRRIGSDDSDLPPKHLVG